MLCYIIKTVYCWLLKLHVFLSTKDEGGGLCVSYTFDNPQPGIVYEFQVRCGCSTGLMSNWSASYKMSSGESKFSISKENSQIFTNVFSLGSKLLLTVELKNWKKFINSLSKGMDCLSTRGCNYQSSQHLAISYSSFVQPLLESWIYGGTVGCPPQVLTVF